MTIVMDDPKIMSFSTFLILSVSHQSDQEMVRCALIGTGLNRLINTTYRIIKGYAGIQHVNVLLINEEE